MDKWYKEIHHLNDLVGLYNNNNTIKYQVRGDGQVYMSGNVGIGTPNPLSGGSASTWLTLNGVSTYSGGTIYSIGGVAKGYSYVDGGGLLTQEAISGQKFVVNNTAIAMTILSNSNIGVGTTTPDAKLAVNGTIHSKEVKVDMNGWSDYVFNKTYGLPRLTEVKSYIDQNHHLPEVPSEQEVIKDGLNLGEMNKLLLKKVEELTLYLIEKDKQVADQNTEMKAQKEALKQQQKVDESLQEQINELVKKLKNK